MLDLLIERPTHISSSSSCHHILYFERFLAFRTFKDFRSERILHQYIACGAGCHLKVNIGKEDTERIINYSREKGLDEVVIEKRGTKYWLKRNSGQSCFVTYSGDTPRCQIYPIRPVTCRLYPLISMGDGLKASSATTITSTCFRVKRLPDPLSAHSQECRSLL